MTQTSKQSFRAFPKNSSTMADDENLLEDNSDKAKRKRGCDTHTKTESSDVYLMTKTAKGPSGNEPDPDSFDKMNLSDESHTSVEFQNHVDDMGNSKSEMHVPISKLQLRVVNACFPMEGGDVVQERVVLAYERPTLEQEGSCYDLDIGFRMHCPLLTRSAHDKPFEQSNTNISLLVLRKRYLQSIFSRSQYSYPDCVTVEGAVYSVHHGDLDSSDKKPLHAYCYCFPLKAGALIPDRRVTIQRVEVVAPAASAQQKRTTRQSAASAADLPAEQSVALVIVEGPVMVTRKDRPHERAQQAPQALLLPQSSFIPLGAPLWDPLYGEVYCGRRLRWREADQRYILRDDDEVLAVKVVRHPNNLWGSTAPIGVHTDCGSRRGTLARIHHPVSAADAPAELTSRHLAGYFEEQSRQGRNENVMQEVETMACIQRAVKAEEASADSVSSSATSAALSQRFLFLTEAAVSEDNLFIATEFLPFNSLSQYMGRKVRRSAEGKWVPAFNFDLTEACVRHVLQQLLEALAFLHDRGIAHQDISLENAVLRVPPAHRNSELARKHSIFLSTEEFLRMEVVLIDMGHVGMHAPCIDSASLQNAQMNSSSTTVDTATTCESTFFAESGRPCEECATAAAPTPVLPAKRVFQLRKSGRFPVGKRPYWAPELAPEVDYHGDGKGPLDREYCGMCVDMWQLGVLAVYLRTGRQPVDCDERDQSGGGLLRRVLTWYGQSRDRTLRDRPVAVRVSEQQKVGVRLHHCFSDEGWDLVSKLLAFRPEDRVSAREALQHPWFRLSGNSSPPLKGDLLSVATQLYAAAAATAKTQS